MVVNVTEFLRDAAGEKELELEEAFAPFIYMEEQIRFASPVQISGVLRKQAPDSYSLKGKLKTKLLLRCGYCLEDYEYPICAEIDSLFAKEQSEDDLDADFYAMESDVISLDECVKTNLIMNLPALRKCRSDCKGLCPICGKNRNEGDCGCGGNTQDEMIPDARFAALKGFFEK